MAHNVKKSRHVSKRREVLDDDEFDNSGTCDLCGCIIGHGEGRVIDDVESEWFNSTLCNECIKDLEGWEE